MTLTPRLTPPAPVDIIPGERVAEMIESADREISELEARAGELNERAERSEREAQASGIDPEASSWGMLRLQRFLDMLREETTRDAAATVDIARHRARLRLEDARNGFAPVATFATVSAQPFVDPPLVRAAPDVPAPAPAPESTVPPVAPEPPSAPPALTFAPDASPPVTPNGNGTRSATLVAPIVTQPFADPLLHEPLPAATVAPIGEPVAHATSEHADFWSAEPTVAVAVPIAVEEPRPEPVQYTAPPLAADPRPSAPKQSLLRRIPLSAILEVLAVLAILVFILLRLS